MATEERYSTWVNNTRHVVALLEEESPGSINENRAGEFANNHFQLSQNDRPWQLSPTLRTQAFNSHRCLFSSSRPVDKSTVASFGYFAPSLQRFLDKFNTVCLEGACRDIERRRGTSVLDSG
jgi:hypothetical protein